ncbi:hypothetical protein MNBD_NITROSPINAE03-1857 [hydrothermal vent metagenome]|uniref:Response regulator n=1 Tax=hydrothermal vent metagenome TaxID=652676 RepID=A0A3B1BQD5_9ZZZZ
MKSILIVDDEESARLALSKAISFLGFKACAVDNGNEAVQLAKDNAFDVILLDVDIAGISGIETLKQIRSDGKSSKSPVIMITTYNHLDSVGEALRQGASDYMVKPFNLAMIFDRVLKWISVNVEIRWKELKPEQENLLMMTSRTLDNAFHQVRTKGELPFEKMQETAGLIITVIENKNITGVLDAVKDHDNYTFVHSLRVGIYLSLFGQALAGFARDDLIVIATGGITHDIGKAKTPLNILNKPAKLNDREMKIMMEHVSHTYDILKNTPGVPAPVVDIGWLHHERMDGSGYPRGLKRSGANILGRMAAIVDVYVALTDNRVYRQSCAPEKAFEVMEDLPRLFDCDLLKDFKEAMLDSLANI